MAPKVATVIANETGQGLTMKVGNRNGFVRYASVEEGGEYTMRLCVDWTYQEFLLEGSSNAGKKLFVNSGQYFSSNLQAPVFSPILLRAVIDYSPG